MIKEKFKARLIVCRGELIVLETWDDELTPTEPSFRSIREWAAEYLENSYPDFRELEIRPAHDSFEVYVAAAIVGHFDYQNEYEEWLEDVEAKYQELPDSFADLYTDGDHYFTGEKIDKS